MTKMRRDNDDYAVAVDNDDDEDVGDVGVG
jgi:hypothetical protein